MDVIIEVLAASTLGVCGYKIGDLIWAVIAVPADRTKSIVGISEWSWVGAAIYIPVLLYVPHGNPSVFPILCGALFLSPLLSRIFILSRRRAG